MKQKQSNKKWKETGAAKLLALGALIILFAFFFLYGVIGNNVDGVQFITNILESAYFVGFLALGVTFVIITGGIDLSIGTIMMCGARSSADMRTTQAAGRSSQP